MRKYLSFLFVIIPFFILVIVGNAIEDGREDNFGFSEWPNKDGVIKTNIEFSVETFQKYTTELYYGSGKSRIRLSLNEPYVGDIQIEIYPSIIEAQQKMLEYLYVFNLGIIPRLTKEEFPAGDVAFGSNALLFLYGEDIYIEYFTRANVLIRITATTSIATELAVKIDSDIQKSMDWSEESTKPNFVITDEFKRAFCRAQ